MGKSVTPGWVKPNRLMKISGSGAREAAHFKLDPGANPHMK